MSFDRTTVETGAGQAEFIAVPGRFSIVVMDNGRPVKTVASFADARLADLFAEQNYTDYVIVPCGTVIPAQPGVPSR